MRSLCLHVALVTLCTHSPQYVVLALLPHTLIGIRKFIYLIEVREGGVEGSDTAGNLNVVRAKQA